MRLFSLALALLVLSSPVLEACADDISSSVNDVWQSVRALVSKKISEAKSKGIGTKPYEDALASIDQDIKTGKPPDEISKRLDSLVQALQSQLAEREHLKSGARSFITSIHRDADDNKSGSPTLSAGHAQVFDIGNSTDPYMMEVQRRIKRQWFPPRSNHNEKLIVRFKISRDGHVSSLTVTSSSQDSVMDSSGLHAIQNASPLRPLPSNLISAKENDVDVEFTFDYNVHSHGN